MANLLAQPDLWIDLSGSNPPPVYWDGGAYQWDSSTNPYFFIQIVGQVGADDTFEAVINYSLQGSEDELYLNYLSSGGVLQVSFPVPPGTGQFNISLPAEAGGAFIATTLPDGNYPVQLYAGSFSMTPEAPAPVAALNCDCSSTDGNSTLAELRKRLMVRLGFAAQAANPPPGMKELLNDFLQSAQVALFRRPNGQFRNVRFYSWQLQAGERFYDYPDSLERSGAGACPALMDPRQVEWVGVERDGVWTPLRHGINPRQYTGSSITGLPQHYEFRNCIELWPAPDVSSGRFIVKGKFEMERFTEDGDRSTIDSEIVFLLALANAKQHYRAPDAQTYIQQLEVMIANLVAGTHATSRYTPGPPVGEAVWVPPRPEVPFP